MTWRRFATSLATIALLALSSVRAGAAPVARPLAPAEADSLVWYVEQLEADLKLCAIRGQARADSLALRLELQGYRLQWALEDRPRWWERPAFAFLGGAVAAILVLSQVLRISF